MKALRMVMLLALAGCADPTPPQSAPALETVPYALLGTGKIAFERIAADYRAVYLVDPVAQSSSVLLTGDFNGPALSPDGQRIAFPGFGGATGWDIFILSTDLSERRQLTAYPGDEGVPSWTPDGTALTFLRSLDPTFDKTLTEVRVSDGAVQRTLALRRSDACPFYAGDSEFRVEVGSTGMIATNCSLYEVVILSSEGTRVGSYGSESYSLITGFAWSPDGSKLAIMEMEGGGTGIPVSQTLRIIPSSGGPGRVVFTVPLTLKQNGRYSGATDGGLCWLKGVNRLVVTILHEARRYSQLWVVNEDGTGLTRITNAGAVTDRSVSCGR